jgi:hypothetical protein
LASLDPSGCLPARAVKLLSSYSSTLLPMTVDEFAAVLIQV